MIFGNSNEEEATSYNCQQIYHNFPKFLDRQVWANSTDPDQTTPRGAV